MTPHWPEGVGRIILDEVASTNAHLKEDATPAPVWCLAHMQTAGQGRRGRAWRFQRGNFAASLRMAPDGGIATFSRYSFVAALALHDALRMSVGESARLALKWPNDVVLSDHKVCGILLETVQMGARTELIIGIGVNLAHAPSPDEMEARALPAGSVKDLTGAIIAPEVFLATLADVFAARDLQLREAGFGVVRAEWRARAMGLGAPITAQLPDATHTGIFEDIGPDGALILRTGTERLVLPAADVYFAHD